MRNDDHVDTAHFAFQIIPTLTDADDIRINDKGLVLTYHTNILITAKTWITWIIKVGISTAISMVLKRYSVT